MLLSAVSNLSFLFQRSHLLGSTCSQILLQAALCHTASSTDLTYGPLYQLLLSPLLLSAFLVNSNPLDNTPNNSISQFPGLLKTSFIFVKKKQKEEDDDDDAVRRDLLHLHLHASRSKLYFIYAHKFWEVFLL